MALWVDDASRKETAIITCLVAVVAVVYFAWNVNKSSKANAKLLPGPRGLPVVGYLPFPELLTYTRHSPIYLESMVRFSSSGLETNCV